MKLGRKPGIVRRPIEYVLAAAALLLVAALLWSVWIIRRDNQDGRRAEDVQALSGTLFEVDRLTEDDYKAEEALDREYDQQEQNAASADSAADNIGGVYDETSY